MSYSNNMCIAVFDEYNMNIKSNMFATLSDLLLL